MTKLFDPNNPELSAWLQPSVDAIKAEEAAKAATKDDEYEKNKGALESLLQRDFDPGLREALKLEFTRWDTKCRAKFLLKNDIWFIEAYLAKDPRGNRLDVFMPDNTSDTLMAGPNATPQEQFLHLLAHRGSMAWANKEYNQLKNTLLDLVFKWGDGTIRQAFKEVVTALEKAEGELEEEGQEYYE